MAQYKGDAVLMTQISDPVPGEHAFDANDQVIAIISNQFEKCIWRCLNIFVNTDLSGIIKNTDVQGTGMQVNSASITMLLGILLGATGTAAQEDSYQAEVKPGIHLHANSSKRSLLSSAAKSRGSVVISSEGEAGAPAGAPG